MNYIKHYDNLISRAIARNLSGYCEIHHIVPRCMGGTDDANNLVNLTASEHFIAHLLLYKMYPSVVGLHTAMYLMANNNRYTNKDYSRLREHYAKMRSDLMQGEGNHMFGKNHSEKTKQQIAIKKAGVKLSTTHKSAISAGHKGKCKSIKTRLRMSIAKTGRVVSPEARANLSKALIGKKRKQESIERQRNTNTGAGNPNFGNGQAVTGEKNGMFGKKWYVNDLGERLVASPNDERLKTGTWQNGKEWK